MNDALLSSKKMNYCTPRDFFAQLDAEFHFALDAAATEKSAKCEKYYTPETDGLSSPWNLAGGLFSATHRMGGRLGNGCGKPTKRPVKERRLFSSFQREQTPDISTITSIRMRKSGSSEDGFASWTKMGQLTLRPRFRRWWLSFEPLTGCQIRLGRVACEPYAN